MVHVYVSVKKKSTSPSRCVHKTFRVCSDCAKPVGRRVRVGVDGRVRCKSCAMKFWWAVYRKEHGLARANGLGI
jgi:hypothetical protein